MNIKSSDPLTPEARHAWVDVTGGNIGERFKRKYRKGQAEHKKDLGEVGVMDLLNELEAEALDTIAYVAELKRRISLTEAIEEHQKVVDRHHPLKP